MFDSDENKASKTKGAPAWMATFADLMALLLCFFVLLLSFSEMDVQKYKQVAGSMAKAFGVQDNIFASTTPMGTSFVARDFTPGRPDPKPIKVPPHASSGLKQSSPNIDKAAMRRVRTVAERIRKKLRQEINKSMVDVETEGYKIIIRIREKNSFPSGSVHIMGHFKPVISKIAGILQETPGQIVVAGHTDNIPISGGRFRSNWELSASRAVTVVHELSEAAPIEAQRFLVEGHGEMSPVAPNDSAANRALNRRVEIVLEQDPKELAKTATSTDSPTPRPQPTAPSAATQPDQQEAKTS